MSLLKILIWMVFKSLLSLENIQRLLSLKFFTFFLSFLFDFLFNSLHFLFIFLSLKLIDFKSSNISSILSQNDQRYFSSFLHSILPIVTANIFIFSSKVKTPTIILLNVDGSIRMIECLSLGSADQTSIELLPIINQNIGLWNCSKCEPFM